MRVVSVFFAITLFTIAGRNLANAETLDMDCESKSGLSTYSIFFELNSYSGTIRYRFMGQDVRYKAYIQSHDSEEVKGIAVFDQSSTGETKGNPFNFRYSFAENVFYELDIAAKCK